jgi:tripartite ATP-independent transporter DctP family solute receptor
MTASAKSTIRIGGIGPVGGTAHHLLKIFKEEVETAAKGDLKVKIYPNSVLGTYEEMLEQIKAGSLEGMYESVGIIAQWHPVAGLEAVPYLYRDAAHFNAVWSRPIGQAMLEDVAEKAGFRVLGPAYRGFRQMALNKPVYKVEDLKGLKFRAPAIPAYMDAFKALGGNPTPLAFEELYTAVQQGVVEGLENPLQIISDHRFYEVTKYLIMTKHMAETMGFMFNEDWYKKQSAENKEILASAAQKCAAWLLKYTEDNEDSTIAMLKEKGMEVINPDLSGFRKLAAAFDPGDDLRPWVEKIRNVK